MPWWAYIMASIGSGAVLCYWAWAGVSIVKLTRAYAELATRVTARENECESRLDWLRKSDEKIGGIAEDTQFIKGILQERSDRRTE